MGRGAFGGLGAGWVWERGLFDTFSRFEVGRCTLWSWVGVGLHDGHLSDEDSRGTGGCSGFGLAEELVREGLGAFGR